MITKTKTMLISTVGRCAPKAREVSDSLTHQVQFPSLVLSCRWWEPRLRYVACTLGVRVTAFSEKPNDVVLLNAFKLAKPNLGKGKSHVPPSHNQCPCSPSWWGHVLCCGEMSGMLIHCFDNVKWIKGQCWWCIIADTFSMGPWG